MLKNQNHTIDASICKQCKLCIAVCPNKMIAVNENSIVCFVEDKINMCIFCGQCLAVCNSGAISINNLPAKDVLIGLQQTSIDYDSYYQWLASRRSHRNFKQEEVSPEIIQKIIDTIYLAPYGFEDDTLHITVVNNRKKIEDALPAMSQFFSKINGYLHSPVKRFFMKRKLPAHLFNTLDWHLKPRLEKNHYDISKGEDNITRNAPCILIFHAEKNAPEHHEDAMIAVTYAALAAHALGLGATINGLVSAAINKTEQLQKFFNIPDNHEAIIALLVGYPKIKYRKGIKHLKLTTQWI